MYVPVTSYSPTAQEERLTAVFIDFAYSLSMFFLILLIVFIVIGMARGALRGRGRGGGVIPPVRGRVLRAAAPPPPVAPVAVRGRGVRAVRGVANALARGARAAARALGVGAHAQVNRDGAGASPPRVPLLPARPIAPPPPNPEHLLASVATSFFGIPFSLLGFHYCLMAYFHAAFEGRDDDQAMPLAPTRVGLRKRVGGNMLYVLPPANTVACLNDIIANLPCRVASSEIYCNRAGNHWAVIETYDRLAHFDLVNGGIDTPDGKATFIEPLFYQNFALPPNCTLFNVCGIPLTMRDAWIKIFKVLAKGSRVEFDGSVSVQCRNVADAVRLSGAIHEHRHYGSYLFCRTRDQLDQVDRFTRL